jgi:hypothetical protein
MAKELIKNKYVELVRLLEAEASQNTGVCEYLNYLKAKEDDFISVDATLNADELREFVRGVNRFSDEFSFAYKHYSLIKQALYELYEMLNR